MARVNAVPHPKRREFQPVTPPDLTGISARLRTARQAAGYSQRELAQKADVSPYTVNKLEKGSDKNTTLDTIVRLAMALGVGPEWLAFGLVGIPASETVKK